VLGLSVQQTNLDLTIDGREVPQLERFKQLGLFHSETAKEDAQVAKDKSFAFPSSVHEMPRLPNPMDTTQPLESRVRSYLHANCANCHVKEGGGNSEIVLSFATPLEKTRTLNTVPTHGSFDLPDAKLIKPSDPMASVLLHRVRLRGRGQMPPLGTSVVDNQAVKMIAQWIKKMRIKTMPPRDDSTNASQRAP